MRRIYFDLDGVLANFVADALTYHGKTIPAGDVRWNFWEQVGLSASEFWEPLKVPKFWAELSVLQDGMVLWHGVCRIYNPDRVAFLSSPGCEGSADGKRAWVKQHFPQGWHRRLSLLEDKSHQAGPGRLLIDDSDENVEVFRKHGGSAILVPRPWNARRNECVGDGGFDSSAILREVEHWIVDR